MKLNHDLIRDIMLYVEENTGESLNYVFLTDMLEEFPSCTKEEILYHCRQLDSAKFVSNITTMSCGMLTWSGHQYLDNIRDKSAWDKVKESGITSMSLDVAKDLAKDVITSMAKKKLGLE